MLNELYDLSTSLMKSGIVPEEWHPELKELPKISKTKPCFKVYLNSEGTVTNIEAVEDNRQIEELRKWQSGGNGYSFPCFNVRPLFKAYAGGGADDIEKKAFNYWLKDMKKTQVLNDDAALKLRAYAIDSNTLWDDDHRKRVSDCLSNIPSKLNELLGKPPAEYRAIAELIDRCRKTTADKFFQQLARLLEEQIKNKPDTCDMAIRLLLYCGKEEPKNIIPLILELDNGLSAFPLPAASSKVHRWINHQLLLAHNNGALHSNSVSSKNRDAFGFSDTDWENKLAEVNVPVLGGVKLRAMNPESPCQTRYRQIDAKSFVVGMEVRKQVKGALEWLTDEERKDKTWGNVSSTRDDKEILLVYPSELPETPIPAVAMFGGTVTNEAIQSARFIDYAKNVTDGLRAINRPLKEVEMRVFALRKMDKGRTQISCARNYTAERLITAAKEWREGCENIPAIQILQWGKEKGAKPVWFSPEVPFPLEVIQCLNTVWTQKADDPARIRQFTSSDGIGLLLDEGVRLRPLLERALHTAIINGGNLLMAMAHTQHHNNIHKISKKHERQKLTLPSIFGLLLAKLGQTKEDYMKSAMCLIGKMLSLADQIHYHYCQHVRKGNTPTQLIGNALMATALEEPVKALALYSQRILPYQAWAKTARGDGVGREKYFLSELGKVCSELALADFPNRCGDVEKAQMILGYLANPEKTESDSNNQ